MEKIVKYFKMESKEKVLEQYSQNHPEELLLVEAEINGEYDRVMIFKGFSSSLVRSTAFDPDLSILPADAKILSIGRLKAPYDINSPTYIAKNLTWEQFQIYL
jgi:hypothetical protein